MKKTLRNFFQNSFIFQCMTKQHHRQKRQDMIEGSRKVYDKVLHNKYSSPSIIRIIKSGKMRLVRHVA
jgi:hypothetical protein